MQNNPEEKITSSPAAKKTVASKKDKDIEELDSKNTKEKVEL